MGSTSTGRPKRRSPYPCRLSLWMAFDVTGLVGGWMANPASNHGVLLKSAGPTYVDCAVASSQSADRGHRPRLVVGFSLPPAPTRHDYPDAGADGDEHGHSDPYSYGDADSDPLAYADRNGNSDGDALADRYHDSYANRDGDDDDDRNLHANADSHDHGNGPADRDPDRYADAASTWTPTATSSPTLTITPTPTRSGVYLPLVLRLYRR